MSCWARPISANGEIASFACSDSSCELPFSARSSSRFPVEAILTVYDSGSAARAIDIARSVAAAISRKWWQQYDEAVRRGMLISVSRGFYALPALDRFRVVERVFDRAIALPSRHRGPVQKVS